MGFFEGFHHDDVISNIILCVSIVFMHLKGPSRMLSSYENIVSCDGYGVALFLKKKHVSYLTENQKQEKNRRLHPQKHK